MSKYVIKRLLQFIPVFLGATFLIYAAVWALPGDPIARVAGQNPLPPSVVAAIRVKYHLDEPLLTQYGYYLSAILRGDMGVDFNDRSVSELIGRAIPTTFQLGITAWGLEVLIGIPMGIWLGLRAGKWDDYLGRLTTVILMSVPTFVVAFAAQMIIGVHLKWLPVAGTRDGWPVSYILPAVVLTLPGLAYTTRLMRASIAETLRADFVTTAIAKGLPRRVVTIKHVLRNSLIPVVTSLGLSLAGIMAGTVIIEGIFNMPGIGLLIYDSIQKQNGPVVVGVSTFLILLFLLVNLLVDLFYAVLDPRIRLE
jgi:oligopeptide transport system permease protein